MSTTNDDSHLDDERSPGFNRAILGRIIAVTLFVGLGTFAVAHSVIGQKTADTEKVALANGDGNGNRAQTPVQNGSPDDRPENPPASISFETKAAAKTNSLELSKSSSSFDGNKTAPGDNSPFPARPMNVAKRPSTAATSGNFQSQPLNKVPDTGSANQFPTLKPGNYKETGNINTLKPPTIQESNDERQNSRLPNPGSETNSINSLTNQFDRAGQTVNNSVDSIRRKAQAATNQLGNLTQNGLRKMPDENPNQSQLTQTAAPDGSGLARQNSNPSQNPLQNSSRNPSQNSLPRPNLPDNPSVNRSTALPPTSVSFDSSRELKPITGGGFPGQPGRASNTPRPNPPSASPPAQSFPPAMTSRSSIDSPSNQRPTGTSLVPASSRFGASTLPSTPIPNRTPATQVAASTTLLTRSSPGDRQLEGMQAPSVTIEKIAPREIQLNQPADFQLIVKNVGRITANDVRVFDEVPVGTELVRATPQPNQTNGNKLDWNLGTFSPGQEKRIQLQLKPTRPGEIGSVAYVTFSAQASMRTRVTKPVLAVQHKSEPKVLIGDTVILDIVIKNEGDGPASNVLIQEDLPEQLEFSDGFRELEYTVGTLAPGQSQNVRLSLKAAQIGAFRNVMIAKADGGLQAQHAIDMEIIAPKLVVSSDGPNRRFLKRQAEHQFSVRNTGTAKATNVELVCQLPKGLQFISTNNRGKYDGNSHAVYWSLAELDPEMAASVQLATLPIEPGNHRLTFEATADLEQEVKFDRDLAVEHLVDIFFDIDDIVDPIEIGSETSYRVRVINQGTKTATNVQLQVELPNGIQPTTVDGNVTSEIRGQQVVFAPITSLNPGDEIVMTINGKGVLPGDHRVNVTLHTDGRETNVSKQETTRVYSDR